MNTKTLLILGVVGIAAYLLLFRKATNKPTPQSPPGNGLVGAGIAAGTKILGALLQTGGGSAQSKGGNVGGGGMVTSYSQLGVPDPGSSSGIITEYD